MHFGNAELLARFQRRVLPRLLSQPGVAGVDATIAAWDEGQPWLDAVLAHLDKARRHVKDVLAAEIPEIRCHLPEATYLAWLDCRALSLQAPTAFGFFLAKAKIGFSGGETFEPTATQFVRMNFATSRTILDEILKRMIKAVRSR
jgi:cystathionine beta-lyase